MTNSKHNTRHNETRNNDTQHNGIRLNDTQSNGFNTAIVTLADSRYADCV